MKIQIGSDLHLEFVRNYERGVFAKNPLFPFQPTDADVLVLAGDIDTGTNAEAAIRRWFQHYKTVLMIPGNHEYYGHDFDNVKEQWRALEKYINKSTTENMFFFLQDKAIYIDGVSFIGSTLWTSFNNGDERIMNIAGAYMNDYRQAMRYKHNRHLLPQDVYEEHLASKKILADNIRIAKEHGDKIVVLTHHAPSKSSTHPKYAKDVDFNHLYSDNYPELLEQANVWFHGHTHESFDYVENGCRIICNPYGYHAYQENPAFDPAKVIEV